jgi:hypothetical protein
LESILGLLKSLKIRALALTVDVEGRRLPEEADEIVTLVPETQLTRRSRRCKLCPRPTKTEFIPREVLVKKPEQRRRAKMRHRRVKVSNKMHYEAIDQSCSP